MLDAIRQLLRNLTGEAAEPAPPPIDARLATAALAVHTVAIDGVIADSERDKLRGVLKSHFELSDGETEALIAEAHRRDREAVDLYAFTSVLKRALDAEGRLAVIGLLWQLVYADGEVREFEDNLVWRVAELLGVSSRERIRLRKETERDVTSPESGE